MNIFHKTALKGLTKSRARTLATIIGAALSTAMFTAVAAFGTSLIQYMVNAEIAKGGSWHVQFSGVSFSQIQELSAQKEITETAAYENIGYARLDGAAKQSADKPYLFLAGFHKDTFGSLPVTLSSGRLPENTEEIIIPDHIGIKAGVRIPVGSALTLTQGNRRYQDNTLTQCSPYTQGEELTASATRTYTVVGTYQRPGFEPHSSPGYTVITMADTQNPADSFSLFLTLKNPRQVHEYAERNSGESAYGINENLLRFLGVSDNKVFNTLLYTIGGVLAAIIMTGSVFLIYNSFQISLTERTHQLGILMSVGATARQLRNSVLFEGICIGIIGIPLGILAGIGCIQLILPVISAQFAGILNSQVPLTLALSLPSLAASALISLASILISAYIPAKKAVSTPVMECIRQTNEIRPPARTLPMGKYVWRLYGLEGVLALKNFRRNKKRFRSVVLSLTLSVILIVTGSAFGIVLKEFGKKYTGETADGDLSFATQDMTEDQFLKLYDKMRSEEGVYKSTWQTDLIYSASTDQLPGGFLKEYRKSMKDDTTGQTQTLRLYTQFIEDDIYDAFMKSQKAAKGGPAPQEADVSICVMNSREHATYFAGSFMELTLASPKGTQAKTVTAVFADSYPVDTTFTLEDDPAYMFVMTAPLSSKAQFDAVKPEGPVSMGGLFWSKTPAQTLTKIQNRLIDEKIPADYTLMNLSYFFDLWRNTDFIISIFTFVFAAMLTLIAVANVFNTMSTNIRLRRRELAMLFSVGMSDRDFRKMMNFECFFYGMRTLLYGIPISTALSWGIHKIFTSIEEVQLPFVLPWGAMLLSILGVFAIVFLTMLYATGKIRKENIIDVLRDEMA